MPKYRVSLEETDIYVIDVEAKDEEEASEIALECSGDGEIPPIDGRREIFEIEELPDDTPGPFPRTDR